MDLGKQMGLQGADLSAFFRDERAAARARQREEQERADREQERADRERERQHEKEQREHEKEQREHERYLLEERRRQELALAEANRSTDINHPGRQSETSPKLPHFDDKKDNMDAYLHRFEDYAIVQGWAEDEWAVNLSALLKGNELETYYRMDTEDRKDCCGHQIGLIYFIQCFQLVFLWNAFGRPTRVFHGRFTWYLNGILEFCICMVMTWFAVLMFI